MRFVTLTLPFFEQLLEVALFILYSDGADLQPQHEGAKPVMTAPLVLPMAEEYKTIRVATAPTKLATPRAS